MKELSFRFVKESDAKDILAIYEPYVKETAITYECEMPSLEEFKKRISDISADYPYIVCVFDEKIVGYAYAHRQMERDAYQWNAELSVYIDNKYFRHGIGRKLYCILIEMLVLQNVKNVYGGVTSPNANSEGLHESMGFVKLGTYHSTGYKCGAWHDVSWFEKQIGDYSDKPESFKSIKLSDKSKLNEILENMNKVN